jgi:hypothetical protein
MIGVTTESVISHAQHGFRRGRSCTDYIFAVSKLIEKPNGFSLPTYFSFIDDENDFDQINRNLLWEILLENGLNMPHRMYYT